MKQATFLDGLIEFLKLSPTPFHAVDYIHETLASAGFANLSEADAWELQPGGSYYVMRNDSSLIAFTIGARDVLETGVRMVGTHTDSPCLKVKPQPEIVKNGYYQLGVEVYGSALLNPWFDRDLSLAGRVSYLTEDNHIEHVLIDFGFPLAVIPSLAIHLDREANENRSIDKQKHIMPILMQMADDEVKDFRELLADQLRQQADEIDLKEVLDYELCFYDTQPPAVVGIRQEFLTSARLDNLLSSYIGLMSFIEASPDVTCMLVCNDHEEVGSVSAIGAQGTFLKSVLQRIAGSSENYSRIIDRSMMVSTDNAHGIHPNYADRYDDNHGPLLNHGPVIKVNANQRYATNSETSAIFRSLCLRAEVPVQSFVVRNDMGCGSTIGPLTASEVGVKTIDVGVPTFAMHSIRETAGTSDAYALYEVLRQFYHE
jgi:aspartyl aminopeptidase